MKVCPAKPLAIRFDSIYLHGFIDVLLMIKKIMKNNLYFYLNNFNKDSGASFFQQLAPLLVRLTALA